MACRRSQTLPEGVETDRRQVRRMLSRSAAHRKLTTPFSRFATKCKPSPRTARACTGAGRYSAAGPARVGGRGFAPRRCRACPCQGRPTAPSRPHRSRSRRPTAHTAREGVTAIARPHRPKRDHAVGGPEGVVGRGSHLVACLPVVIRRTAVRGFWLNQRAAPVFSRRPSARAKQANEAARHSPAMSPMGRV